MIRVLYRHRSGTIINDCPVDQIPAILKDSRSRLWVDIVGEPDEAATGLLEATFRFEALPNSSVEGFHRHTSFEDTGDYVHITLDDAETGDDDTVRHATNDYYLGTNFLVTRHVQPLTAIEALWEEQERRDQLITQGCSAILTVLLEPAANAVEPRVVQHETRVDEISDELYASEQLNRRQLLHEMQSTKNGVRRLAHELDGLRTVFEQLSLPSNRYITDESRTALRGHFQRMQALSYMMEELAERLDVLMTVTPTLTILASKTDEPDYMQPLSLVVMFGLPLILFALLIVSTLLVAAPVARPWIYAVGWLLFLLFLGGMLFYSRRRGWL